jgi:hypothetical protein
MSIRLWSFRQGDRSEYLALYMLSALGLAVPVPRQEDVGIDFHCNLARHQGNIITFFAPYNVQVKSQSDDMISYGGSNDKGIWKGHQIEWILTQEVPFFIAVVDKSQGRMELFTTATRWFAVHHWQRPYELAFRPYYPEGEGHLGDGEKIPLEVKPPDRVEAIRWVLPLGQPVISMNMDEAENSDHMHKARAHLANFIYLDQCNAVASRNGLQQVNWPVIIKTNELVPQCGVWLSWAPAPTMLTHLQLRAMTPLVASLLLAYEHAGDDESIAKLASIVDMLPPDPDLGFQMTLCKEVIGKQRSRAIMSGHAGSSDGA